MASLQVPFSRWDWPERNAEQTTGVSVSSLPSLLLLDGQAVLAHQTPHAIWLFIGLSSGAIWKWTIGKRAFAEGRLTELCAELVMTGHRSPVKALAMAKYRMDCTGLDVASCADQEMSFVEALLSVDEAGELAVWNCHDGRCLLHNLRATASGQSAGYPHTISVSPNSEFCVLAGFSDKLVVLRLSSLEIVQIVEVAGSVEPRWVRTAGFLLQDDPALLLDYLALNFNAPVGECLTARQFDPRSGKFVSPACSILPPTIPADLLVQFTTCHLLTCSASHPGLAALVTERRHGWLVDFLSGDFVTFALDFDIDGIEFVRFDLLMIWSRQGDLTFYQVLLQDSIVAVNEVDAGAAACMDMCVESQLHTDVCTDANMRTDTPAHTDTSARSSPAHSDTSADAQQRRSQSPMIGHVVRRLDLIVEWEEHVTATRLQIKLLSRSESGEANVCSSLLWIETSREPRPVTRASLVHVEFDPRSPDRTVHLTRANQAALPLLFNRQTARTHSHPPGTSDTSSALRDSAGGTGQQMSAAPATCTITIDPFWMIQGHADGRLSRRSILDFFERGGDDGLVITPAPQNKTDSAPITALCAVHSAKNGELIVAGGDSRGQLHFWSLPRDSESFQFQGASRCDAKTIVGLSECLGTFYSWSARGVVAVHRRIAASTGHFATIHVFHPPVPSMLLVGLFWRTQEGLLLLDYRGEGGGGGGRRSLWNVMTGTRLPDLSDSDYLEALSLSDRKIAVDLSGGHVQHRSVENSQLWDGVVTVSSSAVRQWPRLPCQSLVVDVRLLSLRLLQCKNADADADADADAYSVPASASASESVSLTDRMLVRLGRAVLSQSLAWNVASRMDELCRVRLGLRETRDGVCGGLLGANGNVSLVLNPPSRDRFWTLSPTMTATRQLSIILLLGAIPWGEEMAPHIATLVTFYAAQIGEADGGGDSIADISSDSDIFRPAALSFISKFWQDPSREIQHAARILFSATLARLSPSQRAGLIAYWRDYLPSLAGQDSGRAMNRAAIILGIIGAQEPASLNVSTIKHVAESLVSLLIEDKRNLFRLAAVELLGRGYPVWQPYIHGASIFRLLHSWLLKLTLGREEVETEPADPVYHATLVALLHIVAGETSGELLQGWLQDWSAAAGNRGAAERRCLLVLLTHLLEFKPVAFIGLEHAVVDVLIRLMDTAGGAGGRTAPTVQIGLVESATRLLASLATQLGTVAFHGEAQRVAVALTREGTIAVYDLKTGMRTCMLQGHAHPCTLVAFNPDRSDGRQLVSYSAGEACVRWWMLSASGGAGGIFANIMGSGSGPAEDGSGRAGLRPVKTVVVQPALTDALDCIPAGSVFKMKPVELRWHAGARAVEFFVGTVLTMTLSIP